MKPDLQGLEITKGELKHLTGVGFGDVLRPPTLTKFATEIFQTILILIYFSGFFIELYFSGKFILDSFYTLVSCSGTYFR